MSRIFGTILNLRDFFSTAGAEVRIDYYETIVFTLAANRKYIIPDYQREIRWEKEHLIELITDINQGEKFLGNIILNKRNDLEYEVIDGQQRITTLLMVIYYIRSKYRQELDLFETCRLEMANFDQFDLLITNDFDLNNLSPGDKVLIENSDVFNQRERYVELWNVFNQIEFLQDAGRSYTFLTNLRRSQVNLIVNAHDNDNYSIGYFMDVNLKGVKLDNEDIFKGYLFSQDSGQLIRNEWKTFKIESFKLNKLTEYPTTKLLEHYLYCDLYKDPRYINIQFKEDFTINEVVLNEVRHYTGEHIIKVIHNNTYMVNSLKNINRFLTIILDVLNSETPSNSFKGLFQPSANVDVLEITVIYNFIRKIMLDKNVVPRILIMKYIIDVLFDKVDKTKQDYRKIYGMYLLAVMFAIFESEKDIKKVLGVIKDIDWDTKAIEQSKSYFSRSNISKSRITAQYKSISSDDIENHMFRCKSLATIYNFFQISNNNVRVIDGKMNDLKSYVSDSDRFSNEHFIINDRGRFKIVEDANSHNYPSGIKKYANSIFNFIFIKRQLNEELGNNILPEKIRILDEKIAEDSTIIECEFSKMIIEICKTIFSTPESLQDIESYYEESFIEEFSSYASEVIKKIGDKVGVN
jgi:hypothetical protein